MYDDDQRQALGQPSLDILMLKMIVVQVYFFLICLFFYTLKTPFLSSPLILFFHLCNMLCMIMIFFFLVQLCQYHLMFIAQNQPMFGSITASQTSVQIVVFLFFFNLFFFSSKKEIKSAGTEK